MLPEDETIRRFDYPSTTFATILRRDDRQQAPSLPRKNQEYSVNPSVARKNLMFRLQGIRPSCFVTGYLILDSPHQALS